MNTDIIDQANQIIVQGAEMVRRLRETLEEERAERERLQRVVDDLADALRKANARLVRIADMAQRAENTPYEDGVAYQSIYNEAYSGEVRKALDRHGLLRPQDRPEMVPSAWLSELIPDAWLSDRRGGEHKDFGCGNCGANPGEPCAPDCEDRR